MFPIRVVVESVRSGECCRCSNSGNTVVDSYAIVNGQTPMPQLVDTVLTALSLQPLASGAKGMVEINNWRALSFEQVAECSPELTADMVLKDVSNHATLRILTKPAETANSDCTREMRERMLKMVMQRQPQILATIKNPQLQDFVQQLLQSDACLATITQEQMQGFNHWLDELNVLGTPALSNQLAAHADTSASPTNHGQASNNESQALLANGLQGLTSGRFNDKMELPKLIRWFSENDNPSRQKLMQYIHILNQTPFRKHHPQKISFQELSNWFAHARQLQRIQQMANSMLQAAAAANAINASRMQQQPGVANSDLQLSTADDNQGSSSNNDHEQHNNTQQSTSNNTNNNNNNNNSQSQSSPSSSSFSNTSTNASSMHRSSGGSFDLNNLLHAKEAEQRLKHQQSGHTSATELHLADSPESAGQLAAATDQQPALHSPSANTTGDQLDESASTPPPDGVHLNVDMMQMENLARVNADLVALINQANTQNAVANQDQTQNNTPLDLKMNSGAGSGLQAAVGMASVNALMLNGMPNAMADLTGNANLQAAAAAALFNPELMAQFQAQMDNSDMFSHFKPELLFPGAAGLQSAANNSNLVGGSPQYQTSTPDSSSMPSHQNSLTPGGNHNNSSNALNNSNNNNNGSTSTPVNRSRLMFDPLSELPLLEKWFEDNPHPSWIQIDFYTDSLNAQTYRKQYPPISTHNVKIWFKNRRAKNKRLFDSAKQSAAAAMVVKSEGPQNLTVLGGQSSMQLSN